LVALRYEGYPKHSDIVLGGGPDPPIGWGIRGRGSFAPNGLYALHSQQQHIFDLIGYRMLHAVHGLWVQNIGILQPLEIPYGGGSKIGDFGVKYRGKFCEGIATPTSLYVAPNRAV
jgi:hypothetical protein